MNNTKSKMRNETITLPLDVVQQALSALEFAAGSHKTIAFGNAAERLRRAIAGVSENTDRKLPFEFNEEIEFILGRPNFVLGPYAHRLRDLGHDIPKKAEAEQAYVMYLLLELYMKHGDRCRDEFMKMLKLDELGKE